VDLKQADLNGADLKGADLRAANLMKASLIDADLTEVVLSETIFVDLDLSSVIGLETCSHVGPSIIDYRTLRNSAPLPIPFLRGIGLPDAVIDYLPSLPLRDLAPRPKSS
jgi:hypothetical protein